MNTLRSIKALAGFSLWGMGCCVVPANAAAAGFTAAPAGGPPEGWVCGSTGGAKPVWTVEPDGPAGKPLVLKQSGKGRFPWCVKTDSSVANGWVEVKFKAFSGKEDQAGGLVWRWKDTDNYYVARANALENNVSLYYTKGGDRRTIKYVDAPVPAHMWHVLRVEFKDTKVRVSLNGSKSRTPTSPAPAGSVSGPRPTA